MNGRKPHVYLIHGTFAKDAPWIKPSSTFSQILAEKCSAHVHAFNWSGGNSLSDRMQAARELCAVLVDHVAAEPEVELHLVGHSHGGNVIRYAISSGLSGSIDLNQNIKSCTFLGTPFLVHEARNYVNFKDLMKRSLVPQVLFFLIYVVTALTSYVLAQKMVAYVCLVLVGLGAVLSIIGNQIADDGPNASMSLTAVLPDFATRKRQFDLIFDAGADEAWHMLALISLPYTLLTQLATGLISVGADVSRYSKFVALGGVALLAAMFAASGVSSEDGVPVYFLLSFIAFSLVILHFLALSWLVGLVSSIMIIAVGSIRFLQAHRLAFGAEPVSNYFAFDISVRRTPPLEESCARHYQRTIFSSVRSALGLTHSRFYADPRCIEIVAECILHGLPADSVPEAVTVRAKGHSWSRRAVNYGFFLVSPIPIIAAFALIMMLLLTQRPEIFLGGQLGIDLSSSFDNIAREIPH